MREYGEDVFKCRVVASSQRWLRIENTFVKFDPATGNE